MKRNMLILFSVLVIALAAFGATGAQAAPPKVNVCHVPPGDPENFHTITINESVLAAHLAHGDVAGACNERCAWLCDDGDACTIDDTGDCEEEGCPTEPLPVDCSDYDLCTEDLCDPVTGCSAPPAVTCEAPDLCTASVCDPLTGECAVTPIVCPEGEECDLATGLWGSACSGEIDYIDYTGAPAQSSTAMPSQVPAQSTTAVPSTTTAQSSTAMPSQVSAQSTTAVPSHTTAQSSTVADKNIFSLIPIVRAPGVIYKNQTGLAYYKLTNNLPDTTLTDVRVYNLRRGVTQDPVGAGLTAVVINGETERLLTCHNSTNLKAGASCLLKLDITQAKMKGHIKHGPKVCQAAPSTRHGRCFTPGKKNKLNVRKGGAIPSSAPSLTLNPSTLALQTGVLSTMVVTNNSANKTVNNIRPDFGGTALANEVEVVEPNPDNTALCQSLAPGTSCTLTLLSFSQLAISSTAFDIKSANAKTASAQASVAYKAPSALYRGAPISLMVDLITNSDLWASTPKMMSANYAFEGIQGTPNGGDTGQPVIDAGGSWNTITNATPANNIAAYTPAGDVATMHNAFGYSPYYADAMPVCFSGPLLPSSIYPSQFQLILNTGKVVYADVASIAPNYLYNERSCVVIFGQFGNRLLPGEHGAVYPVTVNIVQGHSPTAPVDLEMVWEGGVLVNMTGQSIASKNSYVEGGGPGLLAAKLSVMSNVGQCAPSVFNNNFRNDGISLYGADHAQYRLRVYTSGGFALGNIKPDPNRSVSMMRTDYPRFFKVKVVGPGPDPVTTWLTMDNVTYSVPIPGLPNATGSITISGLAALAPFGTPINDGYVGSNNNYIDIMLYGDLAAMKQITEVVIPSSGINPDNGLAYLPFYNPGGPGNNGTPGVTFSSPGPEVEMPVINALSDARTVTYGTPVDCGY